MRFRNYVTISILGFALSGLWSSIHGIILPILVLNFAGEQEKNTYLGLLTFVGLLLAMAIQPVAGLMSDRSGFRRGKRRPFIIVGALAAIPLIFGLGFASSYAILFLVYCLLQISTNTAQSPWQGLLPDIVPKERTGLASGVKNFSEIFGRIALVLAITPLMARYYGGQTNVWLLLSLSILAAVMIGSMLITVLKVGEQPASGGLRFPSKSMVLESFRIDARSEPAFIPFLVSRLLFLMPLVIITTFGLYLLRDYIGVPDPVQATSGFIVAASAVMLIVAYPAGLLSDRLGRRSISIVSGFIGALAILILFFVHTTSYIYVSAAILGGSYGAFVGANWATAVDLAVKGQEARYLGLVNLATAGSSALARVIGPAIDFFNARSFGLGYEVMLMVCLALYLSSAGILLKTRTR